MKHNPDYAKNKTADVIKHGSHSAIPNNPWEVNRNLTPAGSNNPADVFLPRSPKNRPTAHVKTNECDH